MWIRMTISFLAAVLLAPAGRAQAAAGKAESKLVLQSSDTRLVEGFNWAKRQAMAYVFDGDPVGPWYEAALPGREAFCMRDTAHQATGAHVLGLARYNANMLRRFAENVSESKDWCSYWEIDRYNRPAPVDYKSDTEFWYNLPANFDILDACYRMYVWTGDRTYITDPVFLNFYDRTVYDYVERWGLSLDRVMKHQRRMNLGEAFDPRKRFQTARGIPGYDEGDPNYALGIDLLDAQYAGYLAYGRIQELRGNREAAQTFLKKAAAVRELVNSAWWDEKGQFFYSHLGPDYKFQGRGGLDLLYRDIVDDGPKAKSALGELLAAIKKAPSSAVEGQSHQAEVLYRYGVPDVAYTQMMDLTGAHRARREYPEVSYTVIGAMVTGLMGTTVDPVSPFQAAAEGDFVDRIVRTLPGLGTIAWAELRSLPIRANEVAVRHEGGRKSVFTNQTGPALIWQAAFDGTHETVLVDGQPTKARIDKRPLGRVTSSVRVPVGAGGTVTVEIPK
ncbi:conserved exported hypothetical protein [Candidatus Sulfopaludibacter sp. SbA6]|nr:conserved exported hypothetical protein [Candidatus Sulfopaludibacter sp. SbA6]